MFAALFIPCDFELWYLCLCYVFVLKQMRRKNQYDTSSFLVFTFIIHFFFHIRFRTLAAELIEYVSTEISFLTNSQSPVFLAISIA